VGSKTRLLFVGEHWTDDDDYTGKPFSGGKSTWLRNVIKKAGLEADYTYVSMEKPEGEKLSKEERAAALSDLAGRLQGYPNLEVIVPLGREAMKAFGVKGAVLKVAGIRREWTDHTGRTIAIIPIAQPGYVLRQKAYATTWQSHLHLIKQALLRGDADWFSALGRVHLNTWPTLED
jgi:uracil-DNA glycosylase family 4